MKYVIFDLDGTLSICDHRVHYLEGDKKDWDSFYRECDKDTVNEPIADIFRMYAQRDDICLCVLTGRKGNPDVLKKTVAWLTNKNVKPEIFAMRKESDHRHDVECKKEMIDELGLTPENTLVVFEDRKSMVNAWRLWGFTCCQVAEGNF